MQARSGSEYAEWCDDRTLHDDGKTISATQWAKDNAPKKCTKRWLDLHAELANRWDYQNS